MGHMNTHAFFARNRNCYRTGVQVNFRYNYVTVVQCAAGTGQVKLQTSGNGQTPTTRKWINLALAMMGSDIRVELKKKEWLVVSPTMVKPFTEQMTVTSMHDDAFVFVR